MAAFPLCSAPVSADGMKPIEEVRKGDWVWSVAPETGDPELKQVEDVFVNETDEIVHVRYGDTEIDATPTHPFYTPDRGWVSAVNLRAGDRLQLVNGEYVTVEQIQHEILESPVKVYNFRVADNHTYYVGSGDEAVLVHNANCHANSLKTTKKTELYVLKDKNTGIVKKIGETTRGELRYSKKFYRENNVRMYIIDSGTKRAMHYQQHRLLKQYVKMVHVRPALNKSLW